MALELPQLTFASKRELENWLEAHHESSPGIWLRIAKRGSGVASVSHAEALELALCFGWIDGQRLPLDERFFLQKFTPRRPRSRWSRNNREKAIALREQGRMRPAGIRELEQAQADGRLDDAYDGQRTATVPDDLRRELDQNPAAKDFFATLDSRNRYAILYRLGDAKRPETRARRLAQFVEMLAEGRRLYP